MDWDIHVLKNHSNDLNNENFQLAQYYDIEVSQVIEEIR